MERFYCRPRCLPAWPGAPRRLKTLSRLEQADIASREGGVLLLTPHARGGGSDPPQRLHHMLIRF